MSASARIVPSFLLILLATGVGTLHGQAVPSPTWPTLSLGPSFGFYPPEGGLRSGRWGISGFATIASAPRISLALEAEYQPLFQTGSHFRGFSAFPPPGRFVDQRLVSTRSVSRLGGRLSWAPGPRWLYLITGAGVGRIRRHEERVEKDSIGTVTLQSSQVFQQTSLTLSGGVGAQLRQIGPLTIGVETQGVVAIAPGDDSGPLPFLILSLRLGWVR